jgi:hypothetical protein
MRAQGIDDETIQRLAAENDVPGKLLREQLEFRKNQVIAQRALCIIK